MSDENERSEEEIARRRDETVKRMIATPAKTLKGTPKRPPPKSSSGSSKGKRGS